MNMKMTGLTLYFYLIFLNDPKNSINYLPESQNRSVHGLFPKVPTKLPCPGRPALLLPVSPHAARVLGTRTSSTSPPCHQVSPPLAVEVPPMP